MGVVCHCIPNGACVRMDVSDDGQAVRSLHGGRRMQAIS
jgi:hypothetical protein